MSQPGEVGNVQANGADPHAIPDGHDPDLVVPAAQPPVEATPQPPQAPPTQPTAAPSATPAAASAAASAAAPATTPQPTVTAQYVVTQRLNPQLTQL